jgi:hypothetical protein
MSAAAKITQKPNKASKKAIYTAADDSELQDIIDRFSHDFGFTAAIGTLSASSSSSASATPAPPFHPSTKFEIIKHAIAIDNKHRYKGVTGDLIRFSEIKIADETWKWDDSVPIVHRGRPEWMTSDWLRTLDDFKEEVAEKHTWLDAIVSKNLVLAGGAPVSIIQRAHFGDADLFLVGLSEPECDAEINRVLEALFNLWGVLTVYRTASCVTIRAGELEAYSGRPEWPLVQIILRRYDTVSEVIHGFDNGACAVAYDGEEVWFTSLSKVAFELLVMIPDMTRRRNSYERRLRKYYSRGFGIVLPEIDMEKVSYAHYLRSDWVQLAKLQFQVQSIKGMHIVASSIETTIEIRENPNSPASDTSVGLSYGIYSRIRKLADEEEDDDDDVVEDEEDDREGAEGGEETEEADAKEDESSEYGTIPYNSLQKIAVKNFKAVQCLPVRTKTLCGWAILTARELGTFNFKTIAPRFDRLADEISSHSGIRNINLVALEDLLGKNMAARIIRNVLDRKLIDFERLVKRLLEVIGSRAVIPFEYMEVNDATGLIGPFTMATMPMSAWYSGYFKAT